MICSHFQTGCDTDMVEDVKGLTAGISRKRGKRRYFWEYSEQLIPSKQERMLKPSEWDRDTLPSNLYQKNGLHHGDSHCPYIYELFRKTFTTCALFTIPTTDEMAIQHIKWLVAQCRLHYISFI